MSATKTFMKVSVYETPPSENQSVTQTNSMTSKKICENMTSILARSESRP